MSVETAAIRSESDFESASNSQRTNLCLRMLETEPLKRLVVDGKRLRVY